MHSLILVVHNVRSAHNVGSLLRTADGLAVDEVFLTGYTPYPQLPNDQRLPHEAVKTGRQIHKVALGAEASVKLSHESDIQTVLSSLKQSGYTIAGLEQNNHSMGLDKFKVPTKLVLVVGNEVGGLDQTVLAQTDLILEIPMLGKKESFNVAIAAAMALYHLKHLALSD